MNICIRIKNLTKTFGDFTAVDELDLEIPTGSLYGLIGPNGAGKTTSIRMIMSILFPDSGALEVLGHRSALEAKDRIGYLPEERGVYRKMRVDAFLKHIARLKGIPDAKADARIIELLQRIELAETATKKCEELSKGMLQKIQFVASIIHEPDLIILDEPFSGLDPVSMRLLRDQIVFEHERGATILFSTHVMQQAEDICEHIVMLHKGRKVLDDPIKRIRSQYDPRTILFEPLHANANVGPIAALEQVERVNARDGGFEMILREGSDTSRAMQQLTATLPVARVELSRPRLEDIFIQLVAGGADDADTIRRGLHAAEAAD
jgi:ABC-2 type transport system ATP-binding protein